MGDRYPLRADGLRRTHQKLASVNVRVEFHAFGTDFTQLAQRKDLEAAGIGQDGAIPAHEAVQPAAQRHNLVARAQKQVIRVAEDDGDAQLVQIPRFQRFDGRLRPHGHEDRGLHGAMRGLQDAAAGMEPGQDGVFAEDGKRGHRCAWQGRGTGVARACASRTGRSAPPAEGGFIRRRRGRGVAQADGSPAAPPSSKPGCGSPGLSAASSA